MSYLIGAKAIKKLVAEENSLGFYNAKLSNELFMGEQEASIFQFVKNHQKQFGALPKLETLESQFPEVKELEVPEPSKYYVKLLDNRYAYNLINQANQNSQAALKANKDDIDKAEGILRETVNRLTVQRYRHRILKTTKEAAGVVMAGYKEAVSPETGKVQFGWPYLDDQTGGMLGGDFVAIVGRPATGKTYHGLHVAMHNSYGPSKLKGLFVSMEMNILAIAQRVTAMYAHTNVTQLKLGGYSTQTFNKFVTGLQQLTLEEGELYIVDGNLAASVDDIYELAAILNVDYVWVDGAYMTKHPNKRLDRYTRAAENAELMKQGTSALDIPTGASYQFARKANEKKGKGKGPGDNPDLDDIGYTDVIGQVGTIVLGLFQDEGVETLLKRVVNLLKGRNGEVGRFEVKWDFNNMDFRQWGLDEAHQNKETLDFI